jgi:hypothetical protein
LYEAFFKERYPVLENCTRSSVLKRGKIKRKKGRKKEIEITKKKEKIEK